MTTPSVAGPALKAAVLGGSIAGLMASLVLAKRGFTVRLYEPRQHYTRNIQWGCRQTFIDYLSSIDAEIAQDFVDRLASAITNGYRFLADRSSIYEHGSYIHTHRPDPSQGKWTERDLSGEKSLAEQIVCLVRAQELEKFLREKVAACNVIIIDEKSPDVFLDDANMFNLLQDGPESIYDLIVVCEGASSPTRQAVGIKSMDLSRKVTQVSGEVYLKRHGMIIECLHAIRHENKLREELLLSLLISTDRHTNCWVVGDVSSECLEKIAKLGRRNAEKREVIKSEFRKIAARTMLSAEQNIAEAGYQGAVREVELFTLQAKVSSTAVAGDNLVLAGDAVGVGHWSVGGGMHVAGVCHPKRLDDLATELLKTTANRSQALRKYNEGVLADTIAWISRGIKHYYLSVPGDILTAVFDQLVREVMENNDMNVPAKIRSRVTSVYFNG
ncbi:FAD-dependent oxidoreductase [Mycobacterium vicinigordonae]|uniref:FAD-dependent monooxygenase n=1 Tax=Mycobacterium vicinigordonae TaxID=1719132 RepID=A0A7D6HSR8_9MYCO|nr:FAD-dependent monooxygenase [Mycobacterium vicinigordonae]QLL05733.1 FAD-dependent monooxygenase [Mycobacterium vicinigordonae]